MRFPAMAKVSRKWFVQVVVLCSREEKQATVLTESNRTGTLLSLLVDHPEKSNLVLKTSASEEC